MCSSSLCHATYHSCERGSCMQSPVSTSYVGPCMGWPGLQHWCLPRHPRWTYWTPVRYVPKLWRYSFLSYKCFRRVFHGYCSVDPGTSGGTFDLVCKFAKLFLFISLLSITTKQIRTLINKSYSLDSEMKGMVQLRIIFSKLDRRKILQNWVIQGVSKFPLQALRTCSGDQNY